MASEKLILMYVSVICQKLFQPWLDKPEQFQLTCVHGSLKYIRVKPLKANYCKNVPYNCPLNCNNLKAFKRTFEWHVYVSPKLPKSFSIISIKRTFKWHTYTASEKLLRGYSTDVLLFSLFFPQFYCTDSVLRDVILEATQYVLFCWTNQNRSNCPVCMDSTP